MTHLQFDNRLRAQLPGDPEQGPRRREVLAAWSAVRPTPVAAPTLLAYSADVAQRLGLRAEDLASPQFAEVFGGNALYPGMQPWAVNYGGHQFGHWAGQLGDGRAISLGEAIGVDGGRYELQLKGAGPTPYSRGADGRAVLRSSIREFLCSEAMHYLGVPTTRALSLVGTGDAVVRDMFYDGHPRREPGAIVCRVAPSFIRFGNFELPAARGDVDLLRQWVDFTLARDFPDLPGSGEDRIAAWFGQVCERTAVMVAHWMRVGFVHGVMNTDNMSILGLTIDYGPYGWVDDYDPDWTPNTTDAQGRRYRFGTQPQVAYWNLGRLAQALSPLFGDAAPLQAGLDQFHRIAAWFGQVCERTAVMVAHWMRVGFVHGVMNTDNMSILGLTIDYGPYGWVDDYDPDWTPNTTDAQGRRYRFGTQPQVAYWNLGRLAQALSPLFGDAAPLQAGLDQFRDTYLACDRRDTAAKLGLAECQDEDLHLIDDLRALMREAEMDMTLTFRRLMDLSPQRPDATVLREAFYDETKRAAQAPALDAWLQRYAARCLQDGASDAVRASRMRAANPRYVLRNYLAQQAIDQAEQGDLSGVHALLEVMQRPYDDQSGREAFAAKRPDWARDRAGCSMLSCSS